MAGRPKGIPKTGGRQKGTQNKSTIAFQEKLELLKFDSAEKAVWLWENMDLNPDQYITLLGLIMSYSLYKPKPLEHSVQEFLDFKQMSEQDALAALSETGEDDE